MQAIPGVNDAALILIILAALLAGGFAVFVFTSARAIGRPPLGANADLKHYRADDAHPDWLGAVAVLLVIIAVTSWASQRDERADRAEKMAADLVRAGCPPRQIGDTDVVTLTIDTTADPHLAGSKRVLGCVRYVERGGVRKQIAEVTQ